MRNHWKSDVDQKLLLMETVPRMTYTHMDWGEVYTDLSGNMARGKSLDSEKHIYIGWRPAREIYICGQVGSVFTDPVQPPRYSVGASWVNACSRSVSDHTARSILTTVMRIQGDQASRKHHYGQLKPTH